MFETGFKDEMDEAEAVELVKQAILAGVFNDLGSGSNVDVTVIRAGGETARCAWCCLGMTPPPRLLKMAVVAVLELLMVSQ